MLLFVNRIVLELRYYCPSLSSKHRVSVVELDLCLPLPNGTVWVTFLLFRCDAQYLEVKGRKVDYGSQSVEVSVCS